MTPERIICEVNDNGSVRVLYPPDSTRKICASDEHYATQDEVQSVANDLCAAQDAQEERISDLVQRVRNLERGKVAQPEAVPWEALRKVLYYSTPAHNIAHKGALSEVGMWHAANAPKQGATE